MKTLTKHTLLYDDDCPMCALYSGAFVATGMLDDAGRKPFCNLDEHDRLLVDTERAVNEIALIDHRNGNALYGIDSLLRILGHSFPLIEKIGHFKPVNFLLRKLYSFISYNRKAIIPSPERATVKPACIPSFNLRYRLAYIAIAGCMAAGILTRFSEMLPIAQHGWIIGLCLMFGQLPFQWPWLRGDLQTRVDYLGNLVTVSLMGSLMLVPFLLVDTVISVSPLWALAAFASVATIMFFEHRRRVRLLHQAWCLTASWVVYRILFLILIFWI